MNMLYRPSVCLSVTRVDSYDQSETLALYKSLLLAYKRLKSELCNFSPYSSPIPLVLRDKFQPEILTGPPSGAVKQELGG